MRFQLPQSTRDEPVSKYLNVRRTRSAKIPFALISLMLLDPASTRVASAQEAPVPNSRSSDEEWPLFTRSGETAPGDWDEMRQWMSALLDSSRALSDQMNPETAQSPEQLDLGKLANCDYPTLIPEAVEARRRLLAMSARAIPVAINAFKGLDLTQWDGSIRAYFAHCLLAEFSWGHFGWEVGVEPSNARNNNAVVLAWVSLWRRAEANPGLLEALMDRRDLQRISGMLAEETNPGQDLQGERSLRFIRNEPVLLPGNVVRAKTSVGTIAIRADGGFGRTYSWEGADRFVVMQPRHERWYGSLGIYFPGPGDHWEEHQGITRGVLSEGQMHFETLEEARKWLSSLTYYPHVYRNDGMVVGWGKALSRNQLNVDVWQVLINGRKPEQLPGADDGSITVEHP
jgi:hypothetical protein